MPVGEFTARVERLVSLMKSTPAAAGYDEVLVAGDPEWRTEAERRAGGIPIGDANWSALCKGAARVGVEPPPIERLQ
jgi:LDH2 family malate/lactate/ureidoglycolate dehydrogenase